MRGFFARLVQALSGREAAQPQTRLTSEEAVEIASSYAKTHGLDLPHVHLVPQEVREVDGAGNLCGRSEHQRKASG
jgi:hypothetical protein